MVRLRIRQGGSTVPLVVAAGIGFGIVSLIGGGASWGATYVAEPTRVAAQAGGECNIKGNVSADDGERIYHVPGQKYYARTKIDARYGERWFCSEEEARAAGWRKSKV